MLDIEFQRTQQLSAEDRQAWDEFQRRDPSLDSGYFCPEFTQAVAAVRDDVEVAVLRRAGKAVGFFPFQRSALNLGKPVGGKLSDYHGVIAERGVSVNPEQLVRACGLSGWDFDHLVATQTAFQPYVRAAGDSPYLDLTQGFEHYARERREAGSDTLAKLNRKIRKLEREQGELQFAWHDPSDEVLETLQGWKSAQYRATGFTDVFEFPWTKDLLRQIVSNSRDDWGATVSTLRVGGRLAAACYSLRSRQVMHAWFNAYDAELAAYSPGLVLFERMARAAEAQGVTKIDLGKGDERYKRSLASAATPLWEGSVELNSLSVWLRRGWRRTRGWLEGSSMGQMPARLTKPIRQWMAFR